jgi:hypothetical protein
MTIAAKTLSSYPFGAVSTAFKTALSALVVGVASITTFAAAPGQPTAEQNQFFENKVRPVLVNNCYKCHSSQAEKLKGGLSLEFKESILKGGEHGPAIVPGDPEKSLLIKAVRYTDPDLQMPPRDKKLSDADIDALVTWIRMGAPDPRVAGAKTWAKNPREHWAFQPLKRVAPPQVSDTNWSANPIDAFIFAKLEQNGMKPSAPADKRTLIRRATFDLIGLPPTPEQVKAFVDDNSPDAFAKVVDRLLASPQYGERWGRFWLDVARYSDTKGDVKKNREGPVYANAWTYRDYVIRAFNDDKPYNRFLLEQIAGDKVPQDQNRSALAAEGFLTLGDHFNENINDMINDRIDVISKGTMGLTVTCARCHDHKFDPISQKDYYALHGVFNSSVEPTEEPVLGTIKPTAEYLDYAKKRNAIELQLAALQQNRRGKKKGGAKQAQETKKQVQELVRDLSRLDTTHPGAPPRANALYDAARPKDSYVFIRGEAQSKGDIVPRRFLEIFGGTRAPFRAGSGRLELANCIISPYNPLTPRVLVNRVWMHHFGEGFVTTPDDFGNQSEPPSHPELLDYLAAKFMADGWSIKKLHRTIMLSSTYQQSSEDNPRYAQQDPQNRLLWRANIHRLEFEAMRDSMLAIGGVLDLSMYGRPVNLGEQPYSRRRTLYGYIDRRNLPEVYNQFDFANPDVPTGKRYQTIVPQQALFMMNSPLVVEQARNLVNQKEFTDCADAKARIVYLYERIFQREPTELELQLGAGFITESPAPEKISAEGRQALNKQQRGKGGKKAPAMSLANIPVSQLKRIGAWEKYAHALLQTNEALFIN